MKPGIVVVLALMVLVLCVPPSSASDYRRQKWWKWPSSGKSICSSVVLPLYGNVYPQGYYYAQINVGHPSRPYFVDPDTGSDLTWLQCDAPCVHCTQAPHAYYRPNNDLVPCKDPLCASLHSGDHRCDDPNQCDYEVEYADGGSSLGVLVNDVSLLNLTNGIQIAPRLAIGCGYDQIPGPSYQPLDGVLGLGKGKTGIVSQLHSQGLIKNVVGHCFSSRGGGFLFFGDDIYDSSRVISTPMSRDYSGSSYTYLSSQAYEGLLYLPIREAVEDETLPFCWKGRRPFRSMKDVRKYFKPLALSFSSGWRSKTQFEIPLEGYLLISSKGSVCLGVLNGTEVGLENFNIIGDISMQDKMVIYDNEKQTIGWLPANCDRLPMYDTLNI
ncbi:Aspartic peptidase [Cynara cardunculus var. scolymus]|uniref:Aspartic peptidase n=1 Tax=Cynara cardunculus var. scolymus TaxID=59895 RepID=A0A103XU19_CYNCS|nr:Aspartic peptidase [Cynara cardunculus var. scolymus]